MIFIKAIDNTIFVASTDSLISCRIEGHFCQVWLRSGERNLPTPHLKIFSFFLAY
jgi:hypothetical protein